MSVRSIASALGRGRRPPSALFGRPVDFAAIDPVGPDDLAAALAHRDVPFRRRVVHHMVLAELILRPIPAEVARRVARYAEALGVDDQFVRLARRYAQGAFGLAWMDLHRNGLAEHWEAARMDQLKTGVKLPDQLALGVVDPGLARRWASFEHLDPDTLGRSVWEMYAGRGFTLPWLEGGAGAFLAQHDFVHVIADYFFTSDLKQRHLDSPGMHDRIADAMATTSPPTT